MDGESISLQVPSFGWASQLGFAENWYEKFHKNAPARAYELAYENLEQAEFYAKRALTNLVQRTLNEGEQFLQDVVDYHLDIHGYGIHETESLQTLLQHAQELALLIKQERLPFHFEITEDGHEQKIIEASMNWKGFISPLAIDIYEPNVPTYAGSNKRYGVFESDIIDADRHIGDAIEQLAKIELTRSGSIDDFIESYGQSSQVLNLAAVARLTVSAVEQGNFTRTGAIEEESRPYASVRLTHLNENYKCTVGDTLELGSWVVRLGYAETWQKEAEEAHILSRAQKIIETIGYNLNIDDPLEAARYLVGEAFWYPGSLDTAYRLINQISSSRDIDIKLFEKRLLEAQGVLDSLRTGNASFFFGSWNPDEIVHIKVNFSSDGKDHILVLDVLPPTLELVQEGLIDPGWRKTSQVKEDW